MNITHNLPPDIHGTYEKSEEVLECIVVRKSQDSEFIRASKACKDNLDVVCYILIHQPLRSTDQSYLSCFL